MGRFLIIRHDLDEDPHVLRLTELLNVSSDTVIAKLRRLWKYADLHSDSGHIPLIGPIEVDGIVGLQGFAKALASVGWLEFLLGGVQIPRFEEWIGQKAIRHHIEGTLPTKADWPGFDEWWKQYPNKKAKRDARKAWNALKPEGQLLDKMLAALARKKKSPDWTKENGQFIPYPATWLRGWRWEDEDGGACQQLGQPGRVSSEPGKYAAFGAEPEVQEVAPSEPAQEVLFAGEGQATEPAECAVEDTHS